MADAKLMLVIPDACDVQFDQEKLGVIAAQRGAIDRDDDSLWLTLDPARLAALAPHPVLSDPAQKQLGPFQRDSETSRQAALDNYPRQGTQRARILEALWSRQGKAYQQGKLIGTVGSGGMTRQELARALDLSENTIRPRIVELREGGWVEPLTELSEEDDLYVPVTRKTATGSDAEVLVLTEKARRELKARS